MTDAPADTTGSDTAATLGSVTGSGSDRGNAGRRRRTARGGPPISPCDRGRGHRGGFRPRLADAFIPPAPRSCGKTPSSPATPGCSRRSACRSRSLVGPARAVRRRPEQHQRLRPRQHDGRSLEDRLATASDLDRRAAGVTLLGRGPRTRGRDRRASPRRSRPCTPTRSGSRSHIEVSSSSRAWPSSYNGLIAQPLFTGVLGTELTTDPVAKAVNLPANLLGGAIGFVIFTGLGYPGLGNYLHLSPTQGFRLDDVIVIVLVALLGLLLAIVAGAFFRIAAKAFGSFRRPGHPAGADRGGDLQRRRSRRPDRDVLGRGPGPDRRRGSGEVRRRPSARHGAREARSPGGRLQERLLRRAHVPGGLRLGVRGARAQPASCPASASTS